MVINTHTLLFKRPEFKSCFPVWPQASLVSLVVALLSLMRTVITSHQWTCSESASTGPASRSNSFLSFVIHMIPQRVWVSVQG